MPLRTLPDAAAYVIGHVADHEDAQAVLAAAADGKANVSAHLAGPYPMCRITPTPASSDRDLVHLADPELLVEVWGAPDDESVSPAALRDALYVVLAIIGDLPRKDFESGEPVVTAVRSTAGGAPLPDPITSQPRYLAAVSLTVHPAHSTL